MKPFFSIVIPTRKRSGFLKDAIESVLQQDTSDFECVVSDNSHSEDDTAAVIQSFEPHARLRSIRPPRPLSMPEHWEFATRHAEGEYVLVLPDRKVLYQGALRLLHGDIERAPKRLVSLGVRYFDERLKKMGWRPIPHRGGVYSTLELLTDFLGGDIFVAGSLDPVFPKGLNSLHHRSVAEEARRRYGSYFAVRDVTTPDYSSFFVGCAIEAEVLHVPRPSILAQGEKVSNGRLFGAGDVSEYLRSLRIQDVYAPVPVKAPFIYNLLIADYLRVRETDPTARLPDVDWRSFFRVLRSELALKERAGVAPEALGEFQRAWEEGCAATLGAEAALELDAATPVRPASSSPFREHLRDFANHRLSRFRLANRFLRHRFPTALEAAGFPGQPRSGALHRR